MGEVWGVQKFVFPLVLEAFLKSMEAFLQTRKETGEGLWGKKPLFCLRSVTFLNTGQKLGEVSGVKNVDFSLVLQAFLKIG